MTRDFTKNRSDAYQSNIMEIPFDNTILVDFSDAKSFTNQFNSYNELRLELQDQLKSAYWRIIYDNLTDRQKQVLELTGKKGLTQTAIAKILGVNQSSITKSIHGNCDYKKGKRVYGGAKKKLKKIADADPEIQRLRKLLSEIEDD